MTVEALLKIQVVFNGVCSIKSQGAITLTFNYNSGEAAGGFDPGKISIYTIARNWLRQWCESSTDVNTATTANKNSKKKNQVRNGDS